ncbi:hypothetical protein LDG_7800 [Legionella drancourtii LLAP12]|uniref:Uncharacterized protein n=1 Tax=Legionella drancourtii LLAP12 TaxID=658187 RepID=G9ER88_9GAMM|nr:hypothetical protein LDG_7800 [Legionella drancourtii LLAP12]
MILKNKGQRYIIDIIKGKLNRDSLIQTFIEGKGCFILSEG